MNRHLGACPLQPEVYSLALSLAQAPTAAGETAQLVSSRLAEAALQLLNVLPSRPAARQQLCQLLLAPDGGHLLIQLLLHPQEPAAGVASGAVKPAVLMYAVQCLCGLLFPQGAATMETATPESAQLEALQRRLLLSGTLEALLEVATRQASAQAADAAGAAAAGRADSAVVAATHSGMLLLLQHTYSALESQQMRAAAAVAAQAAAEEPEEAAAAAAAASAAVCAPTSMQIDTAPLAGGSAAAGASSEAAASAPQAAAGSAAAHDPSPSFSMATEDSAADADAPAVGAAELAQAPAAAAEAELTAGVAAAAAATAAAMEELQPAADVLASLAPAVARYMLRMLCCVLKCHPAAGPHTQPAAPAAESGPMGELCSQALLLLRQLARHSSAAVQVIISAEAAATEAVVHSLLLHPTSSTLRQLAAAWLPAFAAAAPESHRWAFERIVLPLLLAEGSGGGGSSSQEQMALCNHFIETLDYSEVLPAVALLLPAASSAGAGECMFVLGKCPTSIHGLGPACLFITHNAPLSPPSVPQFPAARQLLQTLLQRLHTAIADLEPIDGIASVVGALIKRLDCREVGLVSSRGTCVANSMRPQLRHCL